MAEALRRGWADSRVYTVAVQVTTVRQVLVVQQDTGNCCEVWKSNWRRFLVVSLVAFVILIPMITVGSLYIYECPAHWIIPIFLVASGSSALLLLLFIWCFPGVTHPCFMALFSFILYLFLGTNIASPHSSDGASGSSIVNPYKCVVCPDSFVSTTEIIKHLRGHDEKPEDPRVLLEAELSDGRYQCKICAL
ncbi:uncharacterized protein LOC135394782 isoform X2 [Ornithodoros turicata]|uniref:uncharacterized protein LOC135394782 isoform X2 n=1 Tax=Ornithodoros turicata TaxID=34597 RepID=UPI003138B276